MAACQVVWTWLQFHLYAGPCSARAHGSSEMDVPDWQHAPVRSTTPMSQQTRLLPALALPLPLPPQGPRDTSQAAPTKPASHVQAPDLVLHAPTPEQSARVLQANALHDCVVAGPGPSAVWQAWTQQ